MLNINWNLFVVRDIFPHVALYSMCSLSADWMFLEVTGNEYVLQNTLWKYASCFTDAIKIVLSYISLCNIPEVLRLQFYAIHEDFCVAGKIVWTVHIETSRK